jgi:hypothetical protein
MKDPKIIGIGGIFSKQSRQKIFKTGIKTYLESCSILAGLPLKCAIPRTPKKQNTFTGIFFPMTQHTSNHLKKTL